MTSLIQQQRRGKVLWLRLNRAEKLNAMNDALIEELLDCLHQVEAAHDIGAVVLTGNGRAFSAGGDIESMESMNENNFRYTIQLYMQLAQKFRNLDRFVIAAINGYALAGGFELALMCDLRIAASSVKFGLPDVALGLSPTSGMTWSLPRVVGLGRAMHLTLLGDQFSAAEAERFGLVTAVVDDDQLEQIAQEYAERIAEYPREAVAGTKQGFYQAAECDFTGATKLEEQAEMVCFRSGETQKRFADFLAGRKKS